MYENCIFPCSKDYNRSVYSVVVLNDTGVVLNDIEILYGDNNSEHNTVQKYSSEKSEYCGCNQPVI